MLPSMAAALVLGCVMGASAVGTFADGTVNTLLAEHRSEWLGFWGAIIGAVIAGMITVAAALYAAREAWNAVSAQIESDKQIARSNTDRMSQIITTYINHNSAIVRVTNDSLTSVADSDDVTILMACANSYFAMMDDINAPTLREYIETRMDMIPMTLVVPIISFIKFSKSADRVADRMRSSIQKDEFGRQARKMTVLEFGRYHRSMAASRTRIIGLMKVHGN
ncbi:hypothetical protein [Azorhizobium sp. AG788]|uniref:hypothetical protein n=1 Tax=Azorhizobium sp. AG788 TaxID=2183897 RepID=UPI0010615D60|nr:hypothetical protein [Azorhizobium sp. AG788]